MAMDFSKLQDPNYLMALGQGFSQLAWSPISPNTNAPAPMQAYQKSITDQNCCQGSERAGTCSTAGQGDREQDTPMASAERPRSLPVRTGWLAGE